MTATFVVPGFGLDFVEELGVLLGVVEVREFVVGASLLAVEAGGTEAVGALETALSEPGTEEPREGVTAEPPTDKLVVDVAGEPPADVQPASNAPATNSAAPERPNWPDLALTLPISIGRH